MLATLVPVLRRDKESVLTDGQAVLLIGMSAATIDHLPIIGIDSDNGSEFINQHLAEYCTSKKITFTRSRPGNKNDGAHVEQKNWARVRELVGYYRNDRDAELQLLNEIWELDGVFTNYYLPQQKLEILAQAKKAPRAKPRVNTSWNNSDWPRKSHEEIN